MVLRCGGLLSRLPLNDFLVYRNVINFERRGVKKQGGILAYGSGMHSIEACSVLNYLTS